MVKRVAMLAIACGVLVGTPVFAAMDKAGDVGKMSFVEFSQMPQNHGAHWKVIRKNYETYLGTLGKAPKVTLNKTRLRSDEIRKRS